MMCNVVLSLVIGHCVCPSRWLQRSQCNIYRNTTSTWYIENRRFWKQHRGWVSRDFDSVNVIKREMLQRKGDWNVVARRRIEGYLQR